MKSTTPNKTDQIIEDIFQGNNTLQESKITKFRQNSQYCNVTKLVLSSDRPSNYSFGNTKRFESNHEKFINDQIYDVNDQFKYSKSPKWRFPTDKREFEVKAKYDYYKFNQLHSFNQESHWNKLVGGAIQLEKRGEPKRDITPGPGNYYPKLYTILENSPKYTIGVKLDSSFSPNKDTAAVGPGSYDSVENLTRNPAYSIPKTKKMKDESKSPAIHDTYYVYDSCQRQIASKMSSSPKITFAKSGRETENKLLFIK